MKARLKPLCLALGCLAVFSDAHAQAVFTWAANPASSTFETGGNWVGNNAPTAGADLIFDASSQANVVLGAPIQVNSITFSGSYPSYFLSTSNNSTLGIGAGGLTTGSGGSSDLTFDSGLPIQLTASQTWTINGHLTVHGTISESTTSTLTKAGSDSLLLDGANTFTGGVILQAGTLYLANDSALGTGTLTLSGGQLAPWFTDVTLANAVSLGDGVTLGNFTSNSSYADSYSDPEDNQITFTNTVTASANMVDVTLNPGSRTNFAGGLTGAAGGSTISFGGGGIAVLSGTSAATIMNLTADGSALIFDSANALPASSVQALNGGYVGMTGDFDGTSGHHSPADLIAKVTDKADFSGTIGFDSDPTAGDSVNSFHGTIDESGFTNSDFLGLGSASTAEIASDATVIPAGATYKFGGGNGTLTVAANLGDYNTAPTGLALVGPLTLVLEGDNNYSGGTTVDSSSTLFLGSSTKYNGVLSADPSHFNSGPVGTGTLTFASDAQFAPTNSAITLANPIVLTNGLIHNNDDDGGYDLTLSGFISGCGGFDWCTPGTLTLTNPNNTFSGGVDLREGTLLLGSSSSVNGSSQIVSGPAGVGDITLWYGTTLGVAPSAGGAITIHNNISLQADGTFDTTNGSLSLQGQISGDSGIVATTSGPNGGILTLGGGNTFTGAVTITSGATIAISNDANLGAVPSSDSHVPIQLQSGTLETTANFGINANRDITLSSMGGTISTDANTTLTFGGAISDDDPGAGGGTFTKAGAGTLQLFGANTYTGPTVIAGGTLQTAANDVLPDTTDISLTSSGAKLDIQGNTDSVHSIAGVSGTTISINSGGSLTTLGNNSTTFSGSLSGPTDSSFVKDGTGTLTLNGATSFFMGSLTANAGTIALASNTVRNSGLWTFNNSAVLKLSVASALNEAGGVQTTFNDSSKISAQALGSIAGGVQTFNSSSSLQVSATGGTSTGPGVITGGTQNFHDSSLLKAGVTNSISGGMQNFDGTAVLTASGDHAITGGTQNFTTSLELFDSDHPFNLSQTSRLVVNGGGNAGVAGGTQNFSGYSSLQANRANAVTGGMQNFSDFSHLRASQQNSVTGGMQHFTDSAYLWATATGSVAGVSLDLKKESYIDIGATNALGSTTEIYFDGMDGGTGGTLFLNGFGTTVGEISSGSGTSGVIENGGSANATLTVSFDTIYTTFNGMIEDGGSGALSLVKTGTGTLGLAGANTYSGTTTVSGGKLQANTDDALPSTTDVSLTMSGASLELFGVTGTLTIGSIAGVSGTSIILGSGTLATSDNASTTFAGQFSGGMSSDFTKGGSGTLTLTGTGSNAGLFTVSAGTLAIGAAGALNSGTDVMIGTNGTFAVSQDQTIRALSGTGTATIAEGATFTVNLPGPPNSVVSTFSGALSGAGTFAKAGPSTLTLAGSSSSFSGGINVNSGTLLITNAGALGMTTAGTTVNPSGTLELSNVAIGTEPLTLGGNGVLAGDGASSLAGAITLTGGFASINTASVDDTLTLTGSIGESGGSYALSKIGNGILVLAGATSTYTGQTNILGGTLRIGADNALPTTTQLSFSNSPTVATTLDVKYNQTINRFVASSPLSSIIIAATKVFDVTLGSSTQGTGFIGVISGGGEFEVGPSTDNGGHTVTLFNDNTYTGGTLIDENGKLRLGSSSPNAGGSVAGGITDNGILIFDRSNDFVFSGMISGSGRVDQGVSSGLNPGGVFTSGSTTLTNGNNNYTGGTHVNASALYVANEAGSATGSGDVVVTGRSDAIALFGGTGRISGALILQSFGGVSPGDKNNAGTLTVGNATFGPGAGFDFKISAVNGTAGDDWSLLNISNPGTLTITATPDQTFVIVPDGVGPFAETHPSLTQPYSWMFVQAPGGITGFDPSKFSFGTGMPYQFSVTMADNDLFLNFDPAAVPEPSTWALLLTGLAVVGFSLRRRRA